MSYDFSVEIGTGNKPVHVGELSITSNVAPMFAAALWQSITELHGLRMGDLRGLLQMGVKAMKANPKRYEAMNPSNGWGDSKGALRTLETLLQWSYDYPDGTLRICF